MHHDMTEGRGTGRQSRQGLGAVLARGQGDLLPQGVRQLLAERAEAWGPRAARLAPLALPALGALLLARLLTARSRRARAAQAQAQREAAAHEDFTRNARNGRELHNGWGHERPVPRERVSFAHP
jgi:hypothetical protein